MKKEDVKITINKDGIMLYKVKGKIRSFVQKTSVGWEACSGKPSDSHGMCWKYPNTPEGLKKAQTTAMEQARGWLF